MASKVGRVTGHRHNIENGVIATTTLFFHDGSSVDVVGYVCLSESTTLKLEGTGKSPYVLTAVTPVQNGTA